MPQVKNTILKSWPGLKADLESFLSDTDAWIIAELKKAHKTGDWEAIARVIDVMELVHNMHHEH